MEDEIIRPASPNPSLASFMHAERTDFAPPASEESSPVKRSKVYMSSVEEHYKGENINSGIYAVCSFEHIPANTYKDCTYDCKTFLLADADEVIFRYTVTGKHVPKYKDFEQGDLISLKDFFWTDYAPKTVNFAIPKLLTMYQGKHIEKTEVKQVVTSHCDVIPNCSAKFRVNYSKTFELSQVILNYSRFVVRCVEYGDVRTYGDGKAVRSILFSTADDKRVQVTLWNDDTNKFEDAQLAPGKMFLLNHMKRHSTTKSPFCDVSFYMYNISTITLVEKPAKKASSVSLKDLKGKNYESDDRFKTTLKLIKKFDQEKKGFVIDGSQVNGKWAKALINGISEVEEGDWFQCEFSIEKSGNNHILAAEKTTIKKVDGIEEFASTSFERGTVPV